MIVREEINLCDKDEIYSFLGCVKFRKFRYWPNVTDINIVEFLSGEIYEIQKYGKIFTISQSEKIISLLAFGILDWDTQQYGFKCAKIEYILTDKTLSGDIAEESLKQLLLRVQEYCAERNIKLISTSVDSWDFVVNSVLQKANFRYVLTWVDGIFNSSSKPSRIEQNVEVGIIKPDEIDYFKGIVSKCYFKGSRFYLDPNFDKQLVDKRYAALVAFSHENNDIMLVCRIKNQPVGLFVSKKIITYKAFSNLREAPLRFLIVDPKFRNKKIAYSLFMKTLEYLKERSDLITTGFEVHNLPSFNLHSKVGFKFSYTHNVYHWWNNF